MAPRRKPNLGKESGEFDTARNAAIDGVVMSDDDNATQDAAQALQAQSSHIPPSVWQTLQDAGQIAAEKLLALLNNATFDTLAPRDKRALIELALTRAYGLPVKREVSVSLSSSDGDAVAASLAALSARVTLPEYAPSRARRKPQDTQ